MRTEYCFGHAFQVEERVFPGYYWHVGKDQIHMEDMSISYLENAVQYVKRHMYKPGSEKALEKLRRVLGYRYTCGEFY